MREFKMIVLCLFLLTLSINGKGLQESINNLLGTKSGKEQEKILKGILREKPSTDTLIKLLKGIKFRKPEKTGMVKSKNLCIDGVERPFCWYIPDNYDPSKKTPLIVYLHGGVSRPDIIKDIEEYAKENPFTGLANQKGYILLFPFGQIGATWWDSVGVSNILSQIRITKQEFNIDDNQVFMTGFSDGASGSFFFAMCHPNDFAAFIPLSGHPGTGSIQGGTQTYFVNLYNRPLYVINTDLDRLFPDKDIRPMMELAERAGANLLYRVYQGIGHEFTYADMEIPLIEKFIKTHPRVVNPPRIKWETAYPELGRCMWLSIDEVIPDRHADWHEDHNMELIDDRILFGFIPDYNFEGTGIRVARVVGDSTLCSVTGVKEGDIFINLEGSEIKNIDDMNDYKSKKKRGDSTEITILRENKELTLRGKFPEITKYMLFTRDLPSARAEAYFAGNRFYIRSSALGTFTIYIHPDMVQLDQNVVVYVNEKEVFNESVAPDTEFILCNFLENRDRELIYVNKITIDMKK